MSEPIIFQVIPTSGAGSGSLETGVTLSNSCFARQFGFSSWNKIRMGMRVRMLDSGTPATFVINNLALGFCHGTENIPGTNFIDNFVGIKTWNGTSNALGTWYSSEGSYRIDQPHWATANSSSQFTHLYRADGLGTYSRYWMTATTASCLTFFVDIERGPTPTSYTGSMFTWYTNDWVTNPRPSRTTYSTLSDFEYDIQTSVPSRTYFTYRSYSNTNMTDETTYGELNTVCVWWGRENPQLQILDLYVVRLL